MSNTKTKFSVLYIFSPDKEEVPHYLKFTHSKYKIYLFKTGFFNLSQSILLFVFQRNLII